MTNSFAKMFEKSIAETHMSIGDNEIKDEVVVNNNHLKIGDILEGIVKSEKEYGYFISTQECDGLLHKSNLNKKSPWSLGNKHVSIDDYTPLQRRVLVKVIDISSKGYSLKELDYCKKISEESILKSNDLNVILVSTFIKKEIDGSGYYNKIIKNTEMLQVSKKLGVFIFKNLIYIKMHDSCGQVFPLDSGFYSSNDLKNIMYFDINQLCKFYESKSDITHSKTWELNEEISNFNKENDRLYERYLLDKLEKERMDSLFSAFDKEEPRQIFTMYKSCSFDYKCRGHNESDSSSERKVSVHSRTFFPSR